MTLLARPGVPFLFVLALLSSTACVNMDGRYPNAATLPQTADEVAAVALLTEPSWAPFPFRLRTGADVRMMEISGDTIYVVDGKNTAHAMNANTGLYRWVLQLKAAPDRLAVGSDHVAFFTRNHVTVATLASGTKTLEADLEFTPSSNAAVSIDSLYAGAWGNGTRMRSVSTVDAWNGWFYKTDGPVTGAPALVGSGADRLLYFASQDGSVVALPPRPATGNAPEDPVWSIMTLGKNSADVAHDDSRLFIASEDHALYALDRSTGAIVWKWLDAHGPLFTAPVVTGDSVYQPFSGQLAAIDKESGKERYRVAGADRFLTRVGQRDYLKLANNSVAVVDSQTGEELTVVDSSLFDFLPSNPGGAALVFSDGMNVYSIR